MMLSRLLLLCVLLAPSLAHADLTFFWRVEGTTLSGTDDYTAGADTSATLTTATIDGTAALVGLNGLNVGAASARADFNSETAVVDRTVGSIGFHLNIQTFGATRLAQARGTNSSNQLTVQMLGTDTATGREIRLSIQDQTAGTANLDTTAFDMATATHYFVTASWDQPNNKRRIRLYTVSGSTCTLSQTREDTTTGFTAPTELAFVGAGMVFGSSATSAGYYMDNIFWGKAYDDEATFATNCGITSYTSYSAGGASGVPNGLMLMGVGK